jgi:hypothetical protein
MRILGLSGKAGQGKDAVFNAVLQPRGWRRWSFAHTMKAMGYGRGFSFDELLVTKPPVVRQWLQQYGTEEHRNKFRPDYWLRVSEYWLRVLEELGVRQLAFTDVRFPNEAEWIHQQGGKVVRLHGRPVPLSAQAATHPSETALDNWTKWDCVIDNHLGVTFSAIQAELTAAGIL